MYSFELTGKPLELYLLTYGGDIHKGKNNYLDIVKKIKIGLSASKFLLIIGVGLIKQKKVQRPSLLGLGTSVPKWRTPKFVKTWRRYGLHLQEIVRGLKNGYA